MDDVWYEDLGFRENPFEINPIKDKERPLFERDKESKEVIYRILSENMLFIEGASGKGKTALLRHAINNFKGKGKVIYVDSNTINKKLNIEKLLTGAREINPSNEKYPKGMILLLDNVEQLSKLNNERIKYFFDQNYLKSVIFTGKSFNNANFSDSVKSRIGNRIIKLKKLSENSAVDMLLERLGTKNNGLLSEEMIKYIYSKSMGNLRNFLINSYMVSEYTINNDEETVTKDLVSEALKEKLDEESDIKKILDEEKKISEEAKLCDKCGRKLIKIGDYYRCRDCDTFCMDCGAYVNEEDKICPECGAAFV